MAFVYSTATNDTSYVAWENPGNGIPRRKKSILVKGGRGWSPNGKALFPGVTEVSEADAAFLMEDKAFQRHEKAGYVRIEQARHEPEAVVSGMETRDGAAPLVDADFEEGAAPKVGSTEDEDTPRKPKGAPRRGRA